MRYANKFDLEPTNPDYDHLRIFQKEYDQFLEFFMKRPDLITPPLLDLNKK